MIAICENYFTEVVKMPVYEIDAQELYDGKDRVNSSDDEPWILA